MGNDMAETPLCHRLAVGAKQLGRMLGLSLRTIRTMDAAGKLPRPVKLNGHSARWIVSEIESWLAAGAHGQRQALADGLVNTNQRSRR